MGSIYNRGTRSKPNWYVSYKDRDGKRRTIASRQPTKALARRFVEQIESRIADGLVGLDTDDEQPTCDELLPEWAASLRNRNASDDRQRMTKHVLPAFASHKLAEISVPVVMRWIDEQRANSGLADSSIRHNLNLLSRFFSWAIERGMIELNPVRQIPIGKRPKQSRKKDIPWLQDDAQVAKLVEGLPEPANYMFYLGNRSGMRTGEICGIRLSDFGFLDEGVLRVRYSYDGPLKEDKDEEGKTKWVPAADDCAAFLGPWLEKRRAAGALAEDFVFPAPTNKRKPCNARYLERRWLAVSKDVGVKITWYQATRHSFTSRLLAAGVPLDEVSAALGHSSPVVTRRYYDHFIRRSYSSDMRGGLNLGVAASTGQAGPVEAEAALIGAALGASAVLDRVDLEPAHFTGQRERRVWTAMLALHADGQPLDPRAVAERAQVAAASMASYVTGSDAARNVERNADTIRESAITRAVLLALDRVRTLQAKGEARGRDLLDAAIEAVTSIDHDRPWLAGVGDAIDA